MKKRLYITLILLILQGCISGVAPLATREPVPVNRTGESTGSVKTILIAHRCGANLGPENTRSAVIQSSFYRPDFYEIDVRHTADGIPVCLHDPTLDRTTDLIGNISELTYEEIMVADAGSWVSSAYQGEILPTFKQMADSVNPSPMAIELKEEDITIEQCKEMIVILNENLDISSVVMSFHRSALDTWRSAEQSLPRPFKTRYVYLINEFDDFALDGPHEIIGLLKDACSYDVVEEIHEKEKAVWVWTVNDDYLKYLEMKVDGIVTDSPDRMRGIIAPG